MSSAEAAGAIEQRAGRRPLRRYLLASTLLFVLAALTEHPWDGFVFRRTVENWVLSGQTPYETAQDMPRYAYMGTKHPVAPQWFAYPPLALLALAASAGPAVALDAPLWAVRLLSKLPAIVGVLASARLAHALVLPRGPAAASRAESWMLFAPTALVVGGVWGQFEPLLVTFLLAAVLAMAAGRWRWAGAAFGLAILVKPFALFLAPLWMVHAWRRGAWPAIQRSTASGAAVGALFCIPFWLAAPSGFWSQVVGMHAARPPANFSLLGPPYALLRWALARESIGPEAAISAVGLLSAALTVLVLVATARASRFEPADSIHLVKWSTLAFGGALLASKVINEQYLFIPFALAVVWIHAAPEKGPARHLVPALGVGVAAAALLHGFHFLLFVPQDIWMLMGIDVVAWLHAIHLMLVPLGQVNLSMVLAAAALAPAALLLARSIAEALRNLDWLKRAASHGRTQVSASLLVLLGLLVFSGLGGSAAMPPEKGQERQPPLLAVVRSDWWNPSHDSRIPAGRWLDVGEPPRDGYYSVTSAKAVEDARMLSGAGVDGVILVADPALRSQAQAWQTALDRQGMPYTIASRAPTVDYPVPAWHRELYPPASPPEALEPWLGSPMQLHRGQGLADALAGDRHNVFMGRNTSALEAFLSVQDDDVVVVPWNDFGGLGGIEPTGSGQTLEVLTRWSHNRSCTCP